MALFAELIGGVPEVPALNRVNAQVIQQQTLTGNTAALPETIAQTSALTLGGATITDKLLAQASGGVYARLRDRGLSNIEDWLKGGDITDVLRRRAEKNLRGGYSGSPIGFAAGQKEAVDQIRENQARGFTSLERWLAGVNQTYQPVSVGAMFARNTYDLPTALAHATEERNAEFQRDYVKNQWDWYGSFGQKMVRFEDSLIQLAGDVAGAAMG